MYEVRYVETVLDPKVSGEMIQAWCEIEAKLGLQLVTMSSDVRSGETVGVWLIFIPR